MHKIALTCIKIKIVINIKMHFIFIGTIVSLVKILE